VAESQTKKENYNCLLTRVTVWLNLVARIWWLCFTVHEKIRFAFPSFVKSRHQIWITTEEILEVIMYQK